MIKRSSSPDGREAKHPQRGRPMDYLFMRLHQDEEFLRRGTHDGVDYLIGSIPTAPMTGPDWTQRQRTSKPRSQPGLLANALAAWRTYDARRREHGEAPA